LTGTPVSENPNTAFPILKILDPEGTPSRTRFDRHFIVRAQVQAGPISIKKAIGYEHLDELKRMLETCSTRRLKADIRGMPDRTESVRYCTATVAQAAHYESIVTETIAELVALDAEAPAWLQTLEIACVKLLRCRQVLNHPSLLGLDGDSGKYLELDGLVEEVLSNPEAKLLIWSAWNASVDLLAQRYKAYGCITLDQRTSQDDLARMERTFDTSDERIVVASPAKGGTGIDWLSRARTAVYVERVYSAVQHLQSIDRIVRRVPDDVMDEPAAARRLKQIKRSNASIVYLHITGSVDDVVEHVLRMKLDLGEALLTSDRKLTELGRDHILKMLRERVKLAR
jgi:hypothetical protein